MSRTLVLASLFLSSALQASCYSCTLIACASQITLTTTALDLAGRDIDVVLQVGDEIIECQAAAPTTAEEQSICGPLLLSLAEDGALILTSDDSPGEPVDVSLTMLVDGQSRFDGPVEMLWGEPWQPNGPHCGPTCLPGEAEIELTPEST